MAADGRRVQRSTKQSNYKKAQALADKWERAAKLAAEKRLGEAQSRQILSEIYQTLNGEPLASATAREYLTRWAERRKEDTADRTHAAYAQVIRDFMESLGARAEWDISQINKADVVKYRDLVMKRTSAATANKSLKFLRVAMGAAYKEGVTQDNPAAKVDTLKRRLTESRVRRPFTVAELKTILAHAGGDWKGLILFGVYTGQRLKDIARLTWQNLDLEKAELRFVTGKTGRPMHIPLAAPLLAYIEKMPAGDDPAAPLFPAAFKLAALGSAESRLSQQFHGILVGAGLAQPRTKEETGKGHARRRNVSPLSFHSLRHTATSLLKNAGVPEAVAMHIIGHESEAISRNYTHIEDSTMRRAVAGLPDITSPDRKPKPKNQPKS